MATLTADLLGEIALTIDLGERLTLIIVFGPGYLATDGLSEIGEKLAEGRRVLRHRLDRLGPNIVDTIRDAGEARPVVLVSGLERMADERRQEVQSSMNLLRDTLSKHSAAVVLWIPTEHADEFRQLCADLFHWRSLTLYVDGPEHDERRLRHEYLVSLATAMHPPTPISHHFELRVRIAGEQSTQSIESWLDRVEHGLLRGPAGSGKSTALRRYAARRAAALLEDDPGAELPIIVEGRHFAGLFDGWEGLADAVFPRPSEDVRSWLLQQLDTAPEVVLLFDGVDELSPWTLQAMFDTGAFPARVAAHNSHIRLVLTARNQTRIAGNWQEAEVLPPDASAIAAWMRHIGRDSDALVDVLESAGAEPWALMPLLLQIDLRDHESGFRNSTALIGRLVAADLERDFQRGVRHRHSTSTRQIYTALGVFAAHLTQNRRESEDSEHLDPAMIDTLDFVSERSSIILRNAEGGFQFSHRIFRDYFAGLWLSAQGGTPERLTSYAVDPAWRPAILHALGLLSPSELERTIDEMWQASTQEPPPIRWAVRTLLLRATLANHDVVIQARFVQQAKDALHRARQDGEPTEPLAPVEEAVRLLDEAIAGVTI